MRLGFLLSGQYWPYAKWFGTAFARLPIATELSPALHRAVVTTGFPAREAALVEAGQVVARAHNAAGLTAPVDPTSRPFHDRPFQVLDAERFATACRAAIGDPWLRCLPLVGSAISWPTAPTCSPTSTSAEGCAPCIPVHRRETAA